MLQQCTAASSLGPGAGPGLNMTVYDEAAVQVSQVTGVAVQVSQVTGVAVCVCGGVHFVLSCHAHAPRLRVEGVRRGGRFVLSCGVPRLKVEGVRRGGHFLMTIIIIM